MWRRVFGGRGAKIPTVSEKPGNSFARLWEALRAYVVSHPDAVAFMLLATVARVIFWVVTDRRWEDALITITTARNGALGHGLVHHMGEGHANWGFTSPLSVLIPFVGEVLHAGAGMLSLRLASIAGAIVAIGCAEAIARDLRLGRFPTWFAMGYLALERNQIFYGMSGMETQVSVAILLLAALALARKEDTLAGLALGLCPLARPDFVIFVGPALVLAGRRRAPRLAALAAAVLLPWVAFTALYYGSVIPPSIRAKAAVTAVATPDSLGGLVGWTLDRIHEHRHDWRFFCPFLGMNPGVIPVPYLFLFASALVFLGFIVAGLVATVRVEAIRPAAVYVVLYTVYRVLFLPSVYFDWYLPPFQAFCAIFAAAGLTALARRAPRTATALSLTLLFVSGLHFPWTLALERDTQRRYEDETRKPLGLYLATVVPPGEEVMSESAGYFGYYSDVLLWDYPGLTSPHVRFAIAGLPPGRENRTLCRAVDLLRPRWLILRRPEVKELLAKFPDAAARYKVVKVVTAPGDGPPEWGGLRHDLVEFDRQFYLLKRVY
jgi:hypothetical protein